MASKNIISFFQWPFFILFPFWVHFSRRCISLCQHPSAWTFRLRLRLRAATGSGLGRCSHEICPSSTCQKNHQTTAAIQLPATLMPCKKSQEKQATELGYTNGVKYVMIWHYFSQVLLISFSPWAPATCNFAHGARTPRARPKGWGTLQRSMLPLPSHATRPARSFACDEPWRKSNEVYSCKILSKKTASDGISIYRSQHVWISFTNIQANSKPKSSKKNDLKGANPVWKSCESCVFVV